MLCSMLVGQVSAACAAHHVAVMLHLGVFRLAVNEASHSKLQKSQSKRGTLCRQTAQMQSHLLLLPFSSFSALLQKISLGSCPLAQFPRSVSSSQSHQCPLQFRPLTITPLHSWHSSLHSPSQAPLPASCRAAGQAWHPSQVCRGTL